MQFVKSLLQDKKSFLLGLSLGLVLMLTGTLGFNNITNRMRWHGYASPNQKIMEIMALLDAYSIIPFEREILLQGMYRGLLEGVGDPYTHYFDPVALEAFHIRTEGAFVGIGVLVTLESGGRDVLIANVYEDSPAEKAGLRVGDRIISVEGSDVSNRPLEEITSLIKGPAGTTVSVVVLRAGDSGIQRIEAKITREQVNIPTVFSEILPDGTGYIRIEGFDKQTTEQFIAAMQEMKTAYVPGLIVDLRNNPGGLLDVVVDISNIFLPPGVITFTEDVNGNRRYFRADENYISIPLAVLVNERSASASEVFAGAVQDTGVGVLVGEQTFGKGIVQNIFGLSDGSAVKMTVAKYFTPSGASIHGTGLAPDIVVAMEDGTTSRAGRIDPESDAQLQAAIEVVWDMRY